MLDILEETLQLYLQWNFLAKQIIQQCPIFFFFWLFSLVTQTVRATMEFPSKATHQKNKRWAGLII